MAAHVVCRLLAAFNESKLPNLEMQTGFIYSVLIEHSQTCQYALYTILELSVVSFTMVVIADEELVASANET